MSKKRKHTCVFSRAEISQLRRLPADLKAINGMMKLIVGLFCAIVVLILTPTAFIVSQSGKIGELSASTAARHTAALRNQDLQNERLTKLEKELKQEFKKLFWAEKHAKEARKAVYEMKLTLDSMALKKE